MDCLCLICESSVEAFLSFGEMPLANGFLSPEEFNDENRYKLGVGLCSECGMVQLVESVAPEILFHESYPYYSSVSTRMADHFETLAEMVMATRLRNDDPFVVEIGSNDGILMKHFARSGIGHLGVEPSENVARAAMKQGVRTTVRFFDDQLAREIVDADGKADVILGANVFCHVEKIHAVMKGVKILLKPDGVLIFEDPYLGDILEKTSYDQIYDEHLFYFSLTSVCALVEKHDLEVIEVQPLSVHGGSMRYFVSHKSRFPITDSVTEWRRREADIGLNRLETFARFRERVVDSSKQLMDLLKSKREEGKRVVGYGATSKSTTVINYCGITQKLVEFISDSTPTKQISSHLALTFRFVLNLSSHGTILITLCFSPGITAMKSGPKNAISRREEGNGLSMFPG